MFTRKDFVRTAAKIAAMKDEAAKVAEFKRMGRIYENSNPRFDWGRWRTACKIERDYDANP